MSSRVSRTVVVVVVVVGGGGGGGGGGVVVVFGVVVVAVHICPLASGHCVCARCARACA